VNSTIPKKSPKDRILVALDTPDIERAQALVRGLCRSIGGIKLGKEFFVAHGPQGVKQIAAEGLPVFLDLKFHDIPNTVAAAIRAALPMAPLMVNVHAMGGTMMMEAAAKAVQEHESDGPRPLVLAVTVLTSMDDKDLGAIGVNETTENQVVRLARMAQDSGLDGVVCSAREVSLVRKACGSDFTLVVPGIRPSWAVSDDQKRIMTPGEAIDAGADYLVIGRPITAAQDPVQAAEKVVHEIAETRP
jgi:orotidine-5'-phosphate decarboxylase